MLRNAVVFNYWIFADLPDLLRTFWIFAGKIWQLHYESAMVFPQLSSRCVCSIKPWRSYLNLIGHCWSSQHFTFTQSKQLKCFIYIWNFIRHKGSNIIQQWIIIIKKNEKKERLTILQYKYSSVAALYHYELEYIVCNIYLLKFDELVLQSEQLIFSTIC